MDLLRALWTDELVDFEGTFHEVPDMGIRPLPIQRPIPILMGGMAEPVKRRVARMADGWLPRFEPGPEAEAHLSDVADYASEVGRDPDEVDIYGRLPAAPGADDLVERVESWRNLGAGYLSLNTMYEGLDGEEHATHLQSVAAVLDDAGLM